MLSQNKNSYHLKPSIVDFTGKIVAGIKISTTISDDPTVLWKEFMPRRKEITHAINAGFYSIQVYNPSIAFKDFSPTTVFEKWAAIEVGDQQHPLPSGMEYHLIPKGMYAIFPHKGPASSFPKTFNYILSTWLPASEYELDSRDHFEYLGDKYLGPNHPDSEEDVWIPIRLAQG